VNLNLGLNLELEMLTLLLKLVPLNAVVGLMSLGLN
jgi:hypothetical protein